MGLWLFVAGDPIGEVAGEISLYDIAVLKLERKVSSNLTLKLCNECYPTKRIGLCGMGLTKLNGFSPSVLQEIVLKEVWKKQCPFQAVGHPPEVYPDEVIWNLEVQACLRDPESKQATCTGDSGGPSYPLDENGKPICLYGVHSFAPSGCNYLRMNDHYAIIATRVSAFVDWIETQKQEMA
ncbi:chymotrypsin-like elastase family member 1 [Convolutriloba macropyga]|uniref:chymotrypsin-like elastase family member 1 n=1 Tax=Convolutriloba macropyga TaxID=536237 RepID=UPI003F521785